MRCDRFTVLPFAWLLAGLLAASLAPSSTSAVVTSWIEPVALAVADARTAAATLDGDAAVDLDAITHNGWSLRAPHACTRMVSALAPSHFDCDPLGAHSCRAPPLA